jgi:hypothetical protein
MGSGLRSTEKLVQLCGLVIRWLPGTARIFPDGGNQPGVGGIFSKPWPAFGARCEPYSFFLP